MCGNKLNNTDGENRYACARAKKKTEGEGKPWKKGGRLHKAVRGGGVTGKSGKRQ